MSLPPEEMRTHYSSRLLTLAEVHAALTYYYDQKAEIDACFEEDRHWDEGHEERRDEYLRQKAEVVPGRFALFTMRTSTAR